MALPDPGLSRTEACLRRNDHMLAKEPGRRRRQRRCCPAMAGTTAITRQPMTRETVSGIRRALHSMAEPEVETFNLQHRFTALQVGASTSRSVLLITPGSGIRPTTRLILTMIEAGPRLGF